jgi:hypothetical protein
MIVHDRQEQKTAAMVACTSGTFPDSVQQDMKALLQVGLMVR